MGINENLSEPVLIPIQAITDDRGLLVPFTDNIPGSMIKRAYFVENYGRGVIRGLHYHRKEIKMFIVPFGAAKFITLKLPLEIAERNNNDEIKEFVGNNPQSLKTFVLSSRFFAVLIIPPLFANGWIGLEDNTILFSLSNLEFSDAKNDDIRINPYIIGKDKWEVIGR